MKPCAFRFALHGASLCDLSMVIFLIPRLIGCLVGWLVGWLVG